jgi:lipopolysaccharide transport system ATP-binding protein
MSDVAIRVENLGKQYRIGGPRVRYKTLRESIMGAVTSPIRRFRNPKSKIQNQETIWALKDVSFEVKRGEVVGIIGRNGAGKSTLLKILSRITEPTEGYADIHGRVGSLLEVGTGFHPELTGRENIYLNGAILGMRRREIERKFDEIVAFAEIEKFLDTPVKHYSSGMYVRLAFAVAAHLEPEILLVDEVLAVGDAAFQKKCLGKMGEVAQEGRTVLFVSHNMGAIARLCARSLWLDGGRIVLDESSSKAINCYQSQHLKASAEWRRNSDKPVKEFAFLAISVHTGQGEFCTLFNGDEPILVEIQYAVYRSLSGCQIGVRVYTSEGVVVFTTTDADSLGVSALPKEIGQYQARFTIPGRFLAPGVYYVLVASHLPGRNSYEIIEQAVTFEVSPSFSLSSLDGRLGVVAPLLTWNTKENQL